MFISKLKIRNFKCFSNIEIEFNPDFNLIIGENNSGKSTIFEALRLWQLSIQQFYNKRTYKRKDGKENISFRRNYQFEPIELEDISFLRIDDFNDILHNNSFKKDSGKENKEENTLRNTFSIELTFSNLESSYSASIPIVFRPNNKNVLRCKIDIENQDELRSISHSLSRVMGLGNNATFINRIRLAYIPPKFTLPNKETLLSDNNANIVKKLIAGESHLVIRNILHHWCEFDYQVKTKQKSGKTKEDAKLKLSGLGYDSKIFETQFESNIKPFIEKILGYNLKHQTNPKSKFLIEIEKGLKRIIKQEFYLKSHNNPVVVPAIQIIDDKSKTEISNLGSGTVNILNILTVLNFNEQTLNQGDATKCNLLLLDEPDSHLQFNLQMKLFNFLKERSVDSIKQIFIITHNSGLISQFENVLFMKKGVSFIKPIPMSDYLENHLRVIDKNHYTVLKTLNDVSSDRNMLQEQLNSIENNNIPLLYCEGPSDKIILENAYKKLYKTTRLPFNIINGSCAQHLKSIFENESTFTKNPQQIQIALFDFDSAYNQWNGVKGYNEIEKNPYKCLAKKHGKHKGYILLLPIPSIESIKKQVIKKEELESVVTFRNDSILEIEHLLFETYSNNDSYFKKNDSPGEGAIYEFVGKDKIEFANKTEDLNKSDFKHFEPLFQKISEIIDFKLPDNA